MPQVSRRRAAGFARLLLLSLVAAAIALPARAQPGFRFGVPVRRTPAAPATAPNLLYYGGPVMPHVKVVEVLWGSGTYIPEISGSQMAAFYGAVTNSGYMDWLAEYDTNITPVGGGTGTNQTIGRGTFGGQFTITPSVSSSVVTDAQIQSELNAQIAAGHLPAPTADTIYMIHFPDGKSITAADGSQSCVQFCAYHGAYISGANHIKYGVLPAIDSSTTCAGGCGANVSVFANQTSVASHELIEAVTDPEVSLAAALGPPLAWYDTINGEIGDICNAQQGTITVSSTSWTVQKEWSDLYHACIVLPPAPTITGVSPSGGSTAGGTSISISGTNFVSPATVTVGGVAATGVSVANSASITATTPPHAAGAADVTVTNFNGGTVTSAGAFTYACPTVTAAASGGGTICQGQSVGLTGSGGVSCAWTPTAGLNNAASCTPNASPSATTTYHLTVTDAGGCVSGNSATVTVTVNTDTTAPSVTPPPPVTVDQSLCCGAFGGATSATSPDLATFLAGGSATDNCTASPTRLTPQVNGVSVTGTTCFPAGTTAVTFRFQDAGGNTGTASANVKVLMFGDLNLDGAVDPSDIVVMRAYFNFAATPGTPPFAAPLGLADLTHDATVDPSDLVVLRGYFNFAVSCLAP